MEEVLIAPCGMNCAICSAYLAREYDLKKQGIMKSYCAGCRPRGKNCAFMKKSCEKLGMGLVKYCYECADYPCRRLKHLDERYRTNYHMSMIENLEYIRNKGMEVFLVEQERKWRCPECGGTISCHGGVCFKCGVDKLKARGKGRYKWEEHEMKEFPEFMKNSANKVSLATQLTKFVEGYVYDGADGSQMVNWTYTETGQSATHTHEFDEYMLVVQGQYTLNIEGENINLKPGQEYLIKKGVPHSGEAAKGSRIIEAFGGKRAKRVGEI